MFSERSLDLVLTLDNESKRPFLFASVSGVRLGQILPNSAAKFQLEVLPLQKGIQVNMVKSHSLPDCFSHSPVFA